MTPETFFPVSTFKTLDQWLTTGVISPLKGHLAMPGDTFGCNLGGSTGYLVCRDHRCW